MSRYPSPAIVDLRDADAYERDRPAGAVRLTLEDLVERAYLLPPRSRALVLAGRTAGAVRPILESLRQAGRAVEHLAAESWREVLPSESGVPSRQRLWQESETVARAVEQYSDRVPRSASPAFDAPLRQSLEGVGSAPEVAASNPPATPSALDIACGSGRNAVYLAMCGFHVTAIDRLADALDRARDLAERSGVRIRTCERDLEQPGALDDLRADLIVVVRYLERSLFPVLPGLLRPGGLLIYETFTRDQAALGHPRNPRFMLDAGELQTAFPALEALEYEEGFFDGAHLARLIARRSPERSRL